jgi:hypothetical protein
MKKTATRKYMMQHLSHLELSAHGDRRGLLAIDPVIGRPNLLAFVWLDKDRSYKVLMVSLLAEGTRHLVNDRFTDAEIIARTYFFL